MVKLLLDRGAKIDAKTRVSVLPGTGLCDSSGRRDPHLVPALWAGVGWGGNAALFLIDLLLSSLRK